MSGAGTRTRDASGTAVTRPSNPHWFTFAPGTPLSEIPPHCRGISWAQYVEQQLAKVPRKFPPLPVNPNPVFGKKAK